MAATLSVVTRTSSMVTRTYSLGIGYVQRREHVLWKKKISSCFIATGSRSLEPGTAHDDWCRFCGDFNTSLLFVSSRLLHALCIGLNLNLGADAHMYHTVLWEHLVENLILFLQRRKDDCPDGQPDEIRMDGRTTDAILQLRTLQFLKIRIRKQMPSFGPNTKMATDGVRHFDFPIPEWWLAAARRSVFFPHRFDVGY